MSAMGIDCRAATGSPRSFQEPDGPEVTGTVNVTVHAVSFLAPVRIESNANLREHWATRARRNKRQRSVIQWHLRALGSIPKPAGQLVVTITRIAPRRLDDDNAIGGCKAVRDAIAEWLGIDDGSEQVAWRYGQERGRPREYACRVRIEVKTSVGGGE